MTMRKEIARDMGERTLPPPDTPHAKDTLSLFVLALFHIISNKPGHSIGQIGNID